jgi:hypothetical protein
MFTRDRYRGALVLAIMFASAPCALAQSSASAPQPPPAPAEPPSYPIVSVGVLSYLQYDAELKNRDGFNAFDLTRGYINITGDLAKNLKFRITPDVRRVTDGSLAGSLVFRIKYGFVEFDNLTPRSWLRFGVHQTPWLDFEESINRYRVQGPMFAEREGVIPGSGDFGVGYLTRFAGDYGEMQAGIYNGEGYTRAEANKAKSLQARVTIRPLPGAPLAKGLRLSGFYDLGWYDTGQPRRHGIVMASFEHPRFVGTAQWVTATEKPVRTAARDTDRRGYSAFAEVRQGLTGWAALARVDRFDPDTSVSRDVTDRTIAGAAYWLAWDKVRLGLVLNDENVSYGAARGLPGENRLLFQSHVQF